MIFIFHHESKYICTIGFKIQVYVMEAIMVAI